MKTLSLYEARASSQCRLFRNEREKDANARKRVSLYAIRSALAQCKVLRSGSEGDTPFANCVLARLYYILCEIDPEAAREVAGLVQRCVQTVNDLLASISSYFNYYTVFRLVSDLSQSAPI